MRRGIVVGLLVSGCVADRADESAAVQLARAAVGDETELVAVGGRESLTGTHVRFAQLASDGTPIADAEVVVSMGAVERVTTNVWRGAAAIEGSRGEPPDLGGRVEPAALPVGDRLRAGWRVVVNDEELWIDGETGEMLRRRNLRQYADGTGRVYLPNPVTVSGDTTLVDGDDADSTKLDGLRAMVTLRDLDGSGFLRGPFADVRSATTRAMEPSLTFAYTRSDDRFEEVSAYFHVDRAQRHLQSLGYTGAKAILAQPLEVVANGTAEDASFYSPDQRQILLGSGGVDDGEDGDVIVHEYGHAVLDDIVPTFGAGKEASAIGEGFGDVLATVVPTGGADAFDRACLAPWDATAYAGPGGCLRRVDGKRHFPEHVVGEPHTDGEIWSGAVIEMLDATGLPRAEALAIVIEAVFGFSRGEKFAESAEAIAMADVALHGGAHGDAIRRVLTAHGLLETLTPAGKTSEPLASMPITLASTHPIEDGHDEAMTITHAGAPALRVHFASFEMESSPDCARELCDRVYLYDGVGRLYAILGGSLGAFDSVVIPGDTVVVRWIANLSGPSPGFAIDRYDVLENLGPDDGTISEGGGCCGTASAPDSAWLIALLALRRPRRRR